MKGLRHKVFVIIHAPAPATRGATAFGVFIFSLIILNVADVILETTSYYNYTPAIRPYFHVFDHFSLLAFTIEYVLRSWSAVEDPLYARPLRGRLRYALTPLALVDLFAILPFYIPMFIPVDLRFLRILRLIRIFRVFKITRYLEEVVILGHVLRNKKEEIYLTLFLGFVMLLTFSSLMYYVEHDAQPKVFSSIPNAMYWGVVTLATIGYGDIYPITPLGKFIGAIAAILGIGLFALPAGILASGFMEEMRKRRSAPVICPHCGKVIERKEG